MAVAPRYRFFEAFIRRDVAFVDFLRLAAAVLDLAPLAIFGFLATREGFLADDFFAVVFFVAAAVFLAFGFLLGAALFALGF